MLTGQVVDLSSPYNVALDCAFLSGFIGPARCTVQYGTDPTYMNLPYSAESTETGTAGDSVSMVLGERLNSSTVYYYTVSAVSGDLTVVVQGNFTTLPYGKCTFMLEQCFPISTAPSSHVCCMFCILHAPAKLQILVASFPGCSQAFQSNNV